MKRIYQNKIYTVREAAEVLGYRRQKTIREHIAAGRIVAYKQNCMQGKPYWISGYDLLQFQREHFGVNRGKT